MTLVETALTLPEELRQSVCFVWFDNEERGLLGSSAFAGKHKAVKKNALVLNFDCVGAGDSIQFFPSKKVKKTEDMALQILGGLGIVPLEKVDLRSIHG